MIGISPMIEKIIYYYTSYKIAIYAFIVIAIILICKYFWKKYNNYCNSVSNQMTIDTDEIIPDINYKIYGPEQVHHIFWTGGYDSTFRICQLLLIQDRPVQPIYIMCGNTDSENLNHPHRKNVEKEIETMKDIRYIILQNNPHLKNKFLPTFYVTGVKKNYQITASFKRLHQKLGYFSRNVSQYERMARFSSEYKFPIEVGLENCGTGLDEATKGKRIGQGTSCRIIDKLPIQYKDLEIFKNFRFSICHLTKNEMKEIALKNNFFYILNITWSCWYPTKEGQPCGKCQMCIKRIIK